MDTLVCIRVELVQAVESAYFMTYGRVFNPIDPEFLLKLVSRALPKFGLEGKATELEVCATLASASAAPYFYEALSEATSLRCGGDRDYDSWCKSTRNLMEDGKLIWYLGTV